MQRKLPEQRQTGPKLARAISTRPNVAGAPAETFVLLYCWTAGRWTILLDFAAGPGAAATFH
jgi:hypothetical protein